MLSGFGYLFEHMAVRWSLLVLAPRMVVHLPLRQERLGLGRRSKQRKRLVFLGFSRCLLKASKFGIANEQDGACFKTHRLGFDQIATLRGLLDFIIPL